MKVVLVLDVERHDGEIIEREQGAVMVSLRNHLLDNYNSENYVITSVPEFYT